MSASPPDDDALDGSLADAAGLACSAIDVVMKLKKSCNPLRIDIIRD